MAMKTKFYVQTFGEAKNKKLVQTTMRDFKTAEEAERVGALAAEKHVGVLVFALESDDVADLWGDPQMIATYGRVPDEALAA